ncbi:MAG: GHKL domain-containing protein [Ruminococcus sp.]|nr:GHKL domain-containing protein [Ruminococcus sp.]
MEKFWTVIEILAVVIENLILYDFYSRFHFAQHKAIWQKIVYFTFICITSAISIAIDSFTSFSGTLTLICMGTVILYGIFFLKGTIFSKFFLPVVAFGLVFIINISISTICAVLLDYRQGILFTEHTNVRFFCIVSTKFLFFLITRIVLGLFHKGVILRKHEWILMSGISFISLFIGTAVVEIGLESNASLNFSYILCFIGIICIDVFVFIMLSQITRQNQKVTELSLLELQVSQQKQALEHMDIMQNKIRQCNHDHLNHMLCIKEMMKEGNYKEVNNYLDTLVKKNPEVITSHVQIPDCFLRAVLTVKMEQCRQKNIPISLKTDDNTPLCESSDLCILLSNLMDNAIEASTQTANPKIEVVLSKKKDYYTIIVKNRIEQSVLKNNVMLKTTKKDKQWHGIGIQSVREIVHRYNGMMEYYEQDKWFIANVWLRES